MFLTELSKKSPTSKVCVCVCVGGGGGVAPPLFLRGPNELHPPTGKFWFPDLNFCFGLGFWNVLLPDILAFQPPPH